MRRKIKHAIHFKKCFGRIEADAQDTYYWLLLRDETIAREFKNKVDGIKVFFDEKEEEERTDRHQKEITSEWYLNEKKFGGDSWPLMSVPHTRPLRLHKRISNWIMATFARPKINEDNLE